MTEEERLTFLRKKANDLPLKPGVYLMQDSKGRIIYVGKAKKLKNRVTSYFRGMESHTPKVAAMVSHVADFNTITAGSEYEALVLECSLIKQHSPKYNIQLKDAKGFTYIRLSDEEYPRITVEKNKTQSGEYLGPYMSWSTAAEAVDLANHIFGLPTCKREFPKSFGKQRPCLNFHLHQCCGLCQGAVSKDAYLERFRSAVHLLRGGGGDLAARLRREMLRLSDELEFEKAAVLRDQISGIEKMRDRQNVLFETEKEADFIAMLRGNGRFCFSVLKIRGGRLTDKQDYLPREEGEDEDVFLSFLSSYYYQNEDIPPRIYIDRPLPEEETALLARLLSEHLHRTVTVAVPDRGENKKLIRAASVNAREALSLQTGKKEREYETLTELAGLLGLSAPPRRIESYDISNYGESLIVAGMVVYVNGLPCRSAYRRFRLEDHAGQDDYGCMREVLTRRLSDLKNGKKGFENAPDLILLDGGAGHVHVGRQVLEELGLNIPLFGMVKDDRHRTRAVTADGGEVEISAVRQVFRFITGLQDEVHRYSVDYLHRRKKKQDLATALTVIDGIGPVKANRLLMAFGSVKGVEQATEEQLLRVPSMGEKDVRAIRSYFGLDDFPAVCHNKEKLSDGFDSAAEHEKEAVSCGLSQEKPKAGN